MSGQTEHLSASRVSGPGNGSGKLTQPAAAPPTREHTQWRVRLRSRHDRPPGTATVADRPVLGINRRGVDQSTGAGTYGREVDHTLKVVSSRAETRLGISRGYVLA